MRWREFLSSLDWILLTVAILLVLVGLAMFFSTTSFNAPISPLFVRQGVTTVIGIILFFLVSRFPYHSIKRYVPLLYGIGLIILLVVGLTGRVIRGAVSRFEILGFQLQPSELMKVMLILGLAWLVSRHKRISWRFFLESVALFGLPLFFILSEPDVGMASLLLAVWGGVLVFFGLSWRAIAGLCIVGALLGVGAWHWVLLDYQKARIASFVDPTRDPLGAGYNVNQSIVALGSGEFLGRGLGHGPQSQLKFLPERHNDFILASIGEELGFVGIALVITLYMIMLWRILLVARLTSDLFGQIACIGAFMVLLTSLCVSAGMNMGLLPVTGIPLALVSYGGSNLVTTFILLGIVESVRVYSKFAQAPPTEISYVIY